MKLKNGKEVPEMMSLIDINDECTDEHADSGPLFSVLSQTSPGLFPNGGDDESVSRRRSNRRNDDGDATPDRRAFIKQDAVKPEKYNGNSNIKDYLNHFELIANWNGWNMDDKGMQLYLMLEGTAKKMVTSMPMKSRYNYRELVSKLRDTFDQDEAIVYQENFFHRQRMATEDLDDFAFDLEALGRRAFSEMCHTKNEAYHEMMVNRFIMGLNNKNIARAVHQDRPRNIIRGCQKCKACSAL